MTRIYFDTEFIEDGTTIDLLSIGLVRDDGATYYAEPEEADRSRASEWVVENVLPSLTGPVKPRAQIAREIVEFVGKRPEFWAYFADYDWVALCQLYGRMIDLPDGWPMFCRDLKQVSMETGILLLQDGSMHNALGDALWVKEAHANITLGKLDDSAYPGRLGEIRARDARDVLGVHGMEGGWATGGFGTDLIRAIATADVENRGRLHQAFPGLVSAVEAFSNLENGIKILQRIAARLGNSGADE